MEGGNLRMKRVGEKKHILEWLPRKREEGKKEKKRTNTTPELVPQEPVMRPATGAFSRSRDASQTCGAVVLPQFPPPC